MGTKHSITLLFIGFIIASAMFFVEESNYTLSFFADPNELMMLFVFTGLNAAIPLLLFHTLSKRFRKKSIYVACLGFAPALFLFAMML